jgi:hypothetical protein
VAILLALAAGCFAGLIADPGALIVDGRRTSIDYANTGEPRPIGNDATFVFLPHHLSISRLIARFGHLPLWDARGFGGRPMVGNPQGGMFYPPVWLVWWSGAPAALGWLTVGHLVWGGLGVYVLCRSARSSRWAATVAAGTFQASPLLLAHTFEGHYPHVWAVCWYPWAFWAYRSLRAGRKAGLLSLPVILALTFLTGHPQEWLLLIVALSGWVAVDAVRGGRPVMIIVSWAAVVALSLGMTAVELAPQAAVRPWLRSNHEIRRETELPHRHHVSGLNVFQLLSPQALGGPADYLGNDNYWETVVSIGIVPLFLVAAAIARQPERRLVWGWFALWALSLWFACGRHLGFFTLMYSVVPGMSWFRVPARSLFLANLAAAMLTGLGVDALAQANRATWQRFARWFVVVAIVVIGSLTLVRNGGMPAPERATHEEVPNSETVPAKPPSAGRPAMAAERVVSDCGFWFALAGIAVLIGVAGVCSRQGGRQLALRSLGLLALCELGWSGYALLKTAPTRQFVGSNPLGGLCPATTTAPRVKARDCVYGDLAAVVHGVEKTNVNDAFQLDHASALYETLYPIASHRRPMAERLMSQSAMDAWRLIRRSVLDRMSVAYLISDRIEPDQEWPVVKDVTHAGSRVVIQANPSVMPRAYVVPRATIVPDHAGVVLTSFVDIDPRQSVLMGHDPFFALPPGARQPFTAARIRSADPDCPVLAVTTHSPGLLVVADTWMPGWTAQVDDEPAAVLRGNLAQCVIALPEPGRHTIKMRYQPPGLVAGCAISLVSFLAWGSLLIGPPGNRRCGSGSLEDRGRAARARRASGPRSVCE